MAVVKYDHTPIYNPNSNVISLFKAEISTCLNSNIGTDVYDYYFVRPISKEDSTNTFMRIPTGLILK